VTTLPARFNTVTLVLAVAAGLLAGFAASTLAYRYRLLRVPGEPVLVRMSRDLSLTPDQREQIATVMQETRLKVREMRLEMRQQRRQIFIDAYTKIRATLTPEQQAKFDRDFGRPFLRRQRRAERRFGGPPPMGAGGMQGLPPGPPAAPPPQPE
jgi:Spy/CpxP family protein refolding chaperone